MSSRGYNLIVTNAAGVESVDHGEYEDGYTKKEAQRRASWWVNENDATEVRIAQTILLVHPAK